MEREVTGDCGLAPCPPTLVKTILEQMDKRFEAMQNEMNRRFDAVDKRFEDLPRRIDRFMFWSFTITLTVGGFVVAALKLLL